MNTTLTIGFLAEEFAQTPATQFQVGWLLFGLVVLYFITRIK